MSPSPNGAKAALRSALAPWQARWARSPTREQTLVRWAGTVLLLALVWWVAVAPALRTLRTAQRQGPELRAQLQEMLRLQTQAKALQTQASAPPVNVKGQLEAALPVLGASARIVFVGDRATVTVQDSNAQALVQWLGQVRLNARAVPLELHLSQSQGLWAGRVVLQLPVRAAP